MAVNNQRTRSYASQWASYRHRRNVAFVLLFGFVPCWILCFTLLSEVFHFPELAILLAVAWTAGTGASLWWTGQSRCPRCWRRFGALGSKGQLDRLSFGLFDETCNNCKLRKFAESD